MTTALSDLISQVTFDARDLLERFDDLTEDRDHLIYCIEEMEEAVTEAQDRVEELDREFFTTVDEYEEAKERCEAALKETEEDLESAKRDLQEWESDNLSELKALEDAIHEIGESTCRYGEALICEHYFTQYAQDLAEDLYGDTIRDSHWPLNCIDWDQAAKELRQDYSEVDIDGNTFLYRA